MIELGSTTNRFAGALAGAALLLAISGCSAAPPSGTSSSTTPEAPPSVATPHAPDQPTAPVGMTPPPGAKDAPAPPHDAPDLEALIPDAIAGVPMTKTSSRADPGDVNMVELASRLGIQVADIAFAHATTTSDDFVATIEATRVSGADAERLRDINLEANAGSLASGPTEELVGGKQVVAVTNNLGYRFYLYASGDVLYTVSVLDASVAAQVLAALPPP